jgi:hypothetical protein
MRPANSVARKALADLQLRPSALNPVSAGQEAKNWPNIPLQEKFHRVILRGLRNISHTP